MKSGDRSRGDRSDVGAWVDIARRSRAADSAQVRRAEMLCASHRDARLEATLMGDFDGARARRDGDDTTVQTAIAKTLGAIPQHRVALRDGPRLASAIHTPSPHAAVRLQRPKERARHRIAMAIALGVGLGIGGIGGALVGPATVAVAPEAGAARAGEPIASAGSSLSRGAIASQTERSSLDDRSASASVSVPSGVDIRATDGGALPLTPSRVREGGSEVREGGSEVREGGSEAAAIELLSRSRSRHRAGRLLHAARIALEHDRADRAERILGIVARRWPRRVEGAIATRALVEIRDPSELDHRRPSRRARAAHRRRAGDASPRGAQITPGTSRPLTR
jgi:hypothetical protein